MSDYELISLKFMAVVLAFLKDINTEVALTHQLRRMRDIAITDVLGDVKTELEFELERRIKNES